MADDTEDAPGRSRPARALRSRLARALGGALLFLLLVALAGAPLALFRERIFEGQLNSDEPEWLAISILHWNQLVRGAPPAGAEDKPGKPEDGPWQQGVQDTTFGYMNPCLPKLVWGGLFALAGHTQASIDSFQAFHRGSLERASPANALLLPALPLARSCVMILAAISGALVFCVARASLPAGPPWLAAASGAVAMALWLASPLVLHTANYVRTDHFMLPFALGLWWWTLARRDQLAGARGLAPALWAGLAAGILGGLATSGKLNGALALVGCGAGVLAHWLLLPPRRPALGRALAALALAGSVAFGVFAALNPRLWSGPLEGVQDILARWDRLMDYFQEVAPSVGVAVAHTTSESLALFATRTLERDEPLRAYTGLAWGGLWIALGFAAIVLAAAGRGPLAPRTAPDRLRAQSAAACSLAFVLVLVLGTALWLPLDWERFFLPTVPAFAVLGAYLAATLAAGARRPGGA